MQNRSMELVEGRGNVPLTDDQEPAHQHSLDTKADTDRHLQARPMSQCASAWCCTCSLASQQLAEPEQRSGLHTRPACCGTRYTLQLASTLCTLSAVPLQAHYDSVQQIVASTTTPNLLPRLAESLSRNTDYKPLLEALRYAMQASYAHL